MRHPGFRRAGERNERPLRKAWKALERISRQRWRSLNCSAFLARLRKNSATARSAAAAGTERACVLAILIVVQFASWPVVLIVCVVEGGAGATLMAVAAVLCLVLPGLRNAESAAKPAAETPAAVQPD